MVDPFQFNPDQWIHFVKYWSQPKIEENFNFISILIILVDFFVLPGSVSWFLMEVDPQHSFLNIVHL